ncbi:MAG: 2Fe-2S iron-sulfur cluster-binding protein [Lautropia sp.]
MTNHDPLRLPPPYGVLIDRSRVLDFEFEGAAYQGYAGDVVASALAANDIWTLSRSFKYHRPRGILSMAGREANTLIEADRIPNLLADRLPLRHGLVAKGQNVSGSLKADRRAWLGLVAPLLSVGFYYRTFYKPGWMTWEPLIRKHAGLGVVHTDAVPPPAREPHAMTADVLVVGGGLAGLDAAREAAQAGKRVILIDDQQRLGGEALCNGDTPADLLRAAEAELNALGVTILAPAVATGIFSDSLVTALSEDRLYRINARSIVLATGAAEQMAVFRNNDLPGVMLGTAALRLAMLYAVRPGRKAVVLTSTDFGYRVAMILQAMGVGVAAIVDLTGDTPPSPAVAQARAAGIEILEGYGPIEARARNGHRVSALAVGPLNGSRSPDKRAAREIDCDLVAVCVERLPNLSLLAQAGGVIRIDPKTGSIAIKHRPKHIELAGAAAGDPESASGIAIARIFPHPKGKDFVDLDEDLQIGDLLDAVAEGYDHLELTKRYSTVGMGPSQGKHSALPSVAIVAEAAGMPPDGMAFTTVRPPYMPEAMGILAGPPDEPFRLTPMHARHIAAGAQMAGATHWLRPTHYGPPEARLACTEAEALHVRRHVGLIDVSTLGKIEIKGPQAAEFLERIYTGRFANLRVGQIRYALMTDEAGVVIDDGVVARLGPDAFFGTSTTSSVASVFRKMKWWNAQWRMRVDLTNVSASFAAMNLAGPDSRTVLARLCRDLDLAGSAFPYMEARCGAIAGVPARILRIGYVGELGFEIHVPASYGEHVWDALIAAGQDQDIRLFGLDAQRLLRLEKGHFIVGRDSDGISDPAELGLNVLVARSKPFFVGKRSIEMRARTGAKRRLIGLSFGTGRCSTVAEGALVMRGDSVAGRVTSAAYSPHLDRTIALALVDDPPPPEAGIDVLASGQRLRASRAALPFYDPRQDRQSS